MRYHHIIWDFDGTLFNSYPAMAMAFRDTLKTLGIDEPVDTIVSYMTISMSDAVAHYKAKYHLPDDFIANYKHRYSLSKMGTPYDGAADICRAVCKHGGKNYLLTHRGESTLPLMKTHHMLDSFTEIITARSPFPRKPSPQAILYLMEKYDFSPSDAIMIGDRDLDILSGKNAGIAGCFIASHHKASAHADFSVNNLSELYGVLEIKPVAQTKCKG
ncbi:MAG: HAD-IA family hydrolase [Defluviitaleaceae bacterium]|nr:HAD-IA family hydrolase [Defluviitaleaceae bacterium]